MTRENDNPATACRPFSGDRCGLVMGEGAAMLVLESLDSALARGAEPLAEFVGYGCTCDAFHISAPLENGAGAAKAMAMALKHAGLRPADVDLHQRARHGDRPQRSDGDARHQDRLWRARLQDSHQRHQVHDGPHDGRDGRARSALVRAGHPRRQGSAHAQPAARPIPQCDLDYVPNVARDVPVRVAMTNAFGFGGHNSVLIIQRYEE